MKNLTKILCILSIGLVTCFASCQKEKTLPNENSKTISIENRTSLDVTITFENCSSNVHLYPNSNVIVKSVDFNNINREGKVYVAYGYDSVKNITTEIQKGIVTHTIVVIN